jgi:Ca2+-binding RTX toxin-like protein
VGGGKRDLLIGGRGADRLVGNGDDDVLVGGATVYDTDQQDSDRALLALLADWNRPLLYPVRVDLLQDDSRTCFLKQDVTVFDDGGEDRLTGAAGRDLFFANPLDDLVTDLLSDEELHE